MLRKIQFFSFTSLFMIGISFLVSGCGSGFTSTLGSVFTMKSTKVWVEEINFKASEDMNDYSPVTIHVLVVYKPELLDDLLKMDANTYFKKIDQITRDYVGSFDLFKTDVVRGQRTTLKIIPSRVDGEGAIMFVRYNNQEINRTTFGENQNKITVDLGRNTFKIISPNPAQPS